MVSGYGMKARLTCWRGVVFRSRLEARYAALFEGYGWEWKYEPVNLSGWVPDFSVVVGGAERAALVEVKPLGVEHRGLVKGRMVRGAWDRPSDLLLLDERCGAEVYERPLHHGTDLFGREYVEANGVGAWREWSFPAGVDEQWELARERVRLERVWPERVWPERVDDGQI